MRKAKQSESSRMMRPALTPEARENQLVSLAVDLAEKQLREGTASSQVITHYLKLGSTKERIERRKKPMTRLTPRRREEERKGRVAVKMARAIGLSRGVPWCGTLHTVRKRVVFQSILRTGFSTHTEGSRQEWFWVGQRARGGSSRTPVPRL